MQAFVRLFFLAAVTAVAQSSALRPRDPSLQSIPSTGQKDNTFNNGAAARTGELPDTGDTPPDIYGARSIDLPFNRLYSGDMKFFPAGQLNTPDQYTDVPTTQGGIDSANQSACGIPDNAFFDSKVAIHPYFLKYADLSRYCMQDVCISFWKADGKSDMILKVTDICSTDPNDPTHCASPGDIKIDRAKAKVMEGFGGQSDKSVPQIQGNQYPEKTYWFFTKCWADEALVQPGYVDNWFAKPPLPNNLKWARAQATQQYQNNQVAYKAKGWPTYPNGAYRQAYDYAANSPPIDDWKAGSEPGYTSVAGGKGWGNSSSTGSSGSGSGGSYGSSSASPASSAGAPAASPPSGSPAPAMSSLRVSLAPEQPVTLPQHPESEYAQPSSSTGASSPASSVSNSDGFKNYNDRGEECDPEL